MTTTPVRIDTAVLQRFLSKKPKYQTITGFLSQTLEQVADAKSGQGTFIQKGLENSEGSDADPTEQKAVDVRPLVEPINKERTKKPRFKASAELIPENLTRHQEDILVFWKAKKGAKTEIAWNLLINELTSMQVLHGDDVVSQQLVLAAANQWQGITVAKYEQYNLAHKQSGAPIRTRPDTVEERERLKKERERIQHEAWLKRVAVVDALHEQAQEEINAGF